MMTQVELSGDIEKTIDGLSVEEYSRLNFIANKSNQSVEQYVFDLLVKNLPLPDLKSAKIRHLTVL